MNRKDIPMATVHIIPKLNTIYDDQLFKTINISIMNKTNKVGEAEVILMDYNRMQNEGESLDTVARYLAEDIHLAFQALSKHSLFSGKDLCKGMFCRVPVVAYLSRVYIYPEYRRMGFGTAFIKMLPEAIKSITFSKPIAIAVYLSPDDETKEMYKTMSRLFLNAGYFKPFNETIYKRCFCQIERELVDL